MPGTSRKAGKAAPGPSSTTSASTSPAPADADDRPSISDASLWLNVGSARSITAEWMTQHPGIDPDVFLLALYAVQIGRAVSQDHDLACRRKSGVSSADMRVLFALKRVDPQTGLRPTDLFRQLKVTSGAMTKQINRLEAMALVERVLVDPDRERRPESGGRARIRLTSKGASLATAAATNLVEDSPFARALARMPKEDVAAGIRFFDAVVRDLRAR